MKEKQTVKPEIVTQAEFQIFSETFKAFPTAFVKDVKITEYPNSISITFYDDVEGKARASMGDFVNGFSKVARTLKLENINQEGRIYRTSKIEGVCYSPVLQKPLLEEEYSTGITDQHTFTYNFCFSRIVKANIYSTGDDAAELSWEQEEENL